MSCLYIAYHLRTKVGLTSPVAGTCAAEEYKVSYGGPPPTFPAISGHSWHCYVFRHLLLYSITTCNCAMTISVWLSTRLTSHREGLIPQGHRTHYPIACRSQGGPPAPLLTRGLVPRLVVNSDSPYKCPPMILLEWLFYDQKQSAV